MELIAARTLASDQLQAHGLRVWSVGFDRARNRAGACHYGLSVISLSRPLTALHDEDEVRETVLHEIAHALVGPGHGHDASWRRQARAIGSHGLRTLADDAPTVTGGWTGACTGGHTFTRHRRPDRVKACTACTGPFGRRLVQWTWRGVEVRMHRRYVADLVVLAHRGSPLAQLQLDLDAALGGGAPSLVAGARRPTRRPVRRLQPV